MLFYLANIPSKVQVCYQLLKFIVLVDKFTITWVDFKSRIHFLDLSHEQNEKRLIICLCLQNVKYLSCSN